MSQIIDYITRPETVEILEAFYYLAGILFTLGLGFTAIQIREVRKDSQTRNRRAAAEKAIEFSGRYFGRFFELDAKYTDSLDSNELKLYSGPIDDFSRKSISEELLKECYDRYCGDWLDGMNELLIISSAFTSGAADEKIGFDIFGRSFCNTVFHRYDLIAWSRSEKACNYFQPIVDLYQTWSPRMSSEELKAERKDIDNRLSGIPQKNLASFGYK